MQDFAPFIPELLEALSGPQTPSRRGRSAGGGQQFACYFSMFSCYFNFDLISTVCIRKR
jgi:hypothetical protein